MTTLHKFTNGDSSLRNQKPPQFQWGKKILASALTAGLLLATWPQSLPAYQDAQDQNQQSTQPQPAPVPKTPEQLQQLVAPIALYPDSLVAQILAASTFPDQVVEADRWVQQHSDLKGDDLAKAVDQQNWDPSIKALTAFPSVLGNMDKNLSWTSSLGDAYYNQQQDVMDAIQIGGRGGVYNHPGASPHPFGGDNHAARGYGQSHGQNGLHSGAFSGYNHGGQSRSFSARGSSSFGGFHGGGGGFHGGGGHGGGHR